MSRSCGVGIGHAMPVTVLGRRLVCGMRRRSRAMCRAAIT
ncbi:hypothetical protein I547_3765 [Mycobacterium kansasii 824]|nr:hypothetical protein I547_3765 [Mycobacterium kansasii 824]